MNDLKKIKLGEILTESKVEAIDSSADKRIRVLLGVRGVVNRPIMKETSGATKYYLRKKGQFIYGKQNMHKGAFGIVPENLDGYSSSSDLPAFDIHKSCLPEWIIYFLRQNNFYLSLVDIAKGAATKRIQPKTLFDVEIPLPSLDIQASLINNFIFKEEKHKKILSEISIQKDLLFQLKQSILQEAIQGKLSKNWREENQNIEPASVLLERVKAEKEQLIADKKIKKEKTLPSIKKEEIPFELPDKWVWCRLGAISIYINGKGFRSSDFQKNNGIKCIKITNAGVGKIIPTDDTLPLHFKEKYSDFLVYKNDIVIALTRPYISEVLKVSLCSTEYNESLLNQRVATIKALFNTNKYIYNFLRTNFVLNGYKAEFESKGQQPNLKTEHITNLLLPLPPIDEQIEIVKKIESLMQKCDQLEEEIKKSESNAEMLMQSVLKESFNNQ